MSSRNGCNTQNPFGHAELPGCPEDSISAISWYPDEKCAFLAAASWDKSVRLWEVNEAQMIGQPKSLFQHDAPVLCCCMQKDIGNGAMIFSGGCDNIAKAHSLQTQQSIQVAEHTLPVCRLKWWEKQNLLITGSWDCTVKFWDLRSPNAVLSLPLPNKVYAMDVSLDGTVLAVSTGGRHTYVWDLTKISGDQKPTLVIPKDTHPQLRQLRMQLRSLSISCSSKWCCMGSIEGRTQVAFFDPSSRSRGFCWKCHRLGKDKDEDIYAVNAIAFHPKLPELVATGGSDGSIKFWDVLEKRNTKGFSSNRTPVIDIKWHPAGNIFAYALGYDWCKGGEPQYAQGLPNKIFFAKVTPDDLKGSQEKPSSGGR